MKHNAVTKSRRPTVRRTPPARLARPVTARRTATTAPRRAGSLDNAFFRHTLASMRNGALLLTREGLLALINEEAYRIFEITPHRTNLGQPIGEVLGDHPEVVQPLQGVFDMHQLPNRAELRLRPSGKVLGYTLALVRDDTGCVVGASMFFEDLTGSSPRARSPRPSRRAQPAASVPQPLTFLELLDVRWEALQTRASES